MNAITEGSQHKGGRNLSDPTPRPDPPEAQGDGRDVGQAACVMQTEEPESVIKVGLKNGRVVKVDWFDLAGKESMAQSDVADLLMTACHMVDSGLNEGELAKYYLNGEELSCPQGCTRYYEELCELAYPKHMGSWDGYSMTIKSPRAEGRILYKGQTTTMLHGTHVDVYRTG